MQSGASANLNQARKALTHQPCKQGKQPLRNRFIFFFKQLVLLLIMHEPEMLLFKGWKNPHALVSTISSASKPAKLPTHLLGFAGKAHAQLHLLFTHSTSEQIQLNYFEQIWQDFFALQKKLPQHPQKVCNRSLHSALCTERPWTQYKVNASIS